MPPIRAHVQSSTGVVGIQRVRTAPLAVGAALTLVAFALRIFRLDHQSLWGDEAISVFRALDSLSAITAAVPAEGTLPPLYYYLLHWWIPAVGQTEFAVRFLSLVWGVLAVPLLLVLVNRVAGQRQAIAAAGLAAVSPFWIYYSQETRTYSLVCALATLALYLLIRASADASWRTGFLPWGAYCLAAALALASNYFAGFVLGVGVLTCLLANRRSLEVVARCVTAQLGTVALLLPLLIFAAPGLLATAGSVSRAGVPLATVLPHLVQVFTVGPSVEWNRVWPLAAAGAILAAAGVLVGGRGRWFWLAALVVPIACIYFVSFNQYRGWARYFITASPAWYALVGAGAVALFLPSGTIPSLARWSARLACIGLAVALALGIGWSLRNYYFRPEYARYDFRSAVAEVEAAGSSGIAIVNGPTRFPSYFYYHRPGFAAIEMPAEAGQRGIADAMSAETTGRSLVWLVKYNPPEYDPDGAVERWLAEHTYRHSVRWVENATFTLYLRWPDAGCPNAWSAVIGSSFAAMATLTEYDTCVVSVGGADYLLLDVGWRPDAETKDDIWAFVHLGYQLGTASKFFQGIWFGNEAYNRLATWISSPTEPNPQANWAMAIGFGICSLLMFLRLKLLWFPFHPIGFAISGSWSMNLVWLPLFIAWLIKWLVLRYGSLQTYRRFEPFFLGLMLGEFIVGSIWSLLGMVYDLPTYSFWGA